MTRQKVPKSRDELANGFFRMYMAGRQWKEKLAAGEITTDEIWEMAFQKADERLNERLEALEAGHKEHIDLAKDDQMYREDREEQYREDYDWSIKSDEKILQNILDVEVNIRQVKRRLGEDDKNITVKDRDTLLDRHSKLVSLHADLLNKAGIDRVAREKKKSNEDPIEDWERIKDLAGKKMKELQLEFPQALSRSNTESDLRNKIKFHLAYPFDIVDAILLHHRRVLGIDTQVKTD